MTFACSIHSGVQFIMQLRRIMTGKNCNGGTGKIKPTTNDPRVNSFAILNTLTTLKNKISAEYKQAIKSKMIQMSKQKSNLQCLFPGE
jgi:hypothetical protein